MNLPCKQSSAKQILHVCSLATKPSRLDRARRLLVKRIVRLKRARIGLLNYEKGNNGVNGGCVNIQVYIYIDIPQ